ncbi:MAG: phosphate ABC transporter permease subunit PstC [Zetaproteobacteria bacterium CG_4_9_14_3_um_filter_49_83]|nr:MAG: phosphate ABC transporter permease subunit PstC [Zetaproteobacteria bacterium CG1_02_49_23]PIQ31563.1 MAG: phosphate ABC transporter permease subunit PstC [Zetaproteobacteria bacterium CG17_big_fil_post_rev_8_21_14_2_50_50_13]PIV30967.1 MAG: phosphate ABC transporter permease subunit PstC [Zetaproteobacteria bacterium CG02_land_8_20_14_3_00_50_9]PIY54680.1 MAG: phosphate ABC transporter permease subunit PstC [Zetaproteobacteria bacterium CG_4_10_14_0_8_um_filter_49_80]PJA35624.1 MAG: ph
MTISTIFMLFFGGLIPLMLMAYWLARGKAIRLAVEGKGAGTRLHSLPSFHGWYAAIWISLPALASGFLFSVLHLSGLLEVPGPMLLASSFLLAASGLWMGMQHITLDFRARQAVEKVMRGMLFAAATISILTTIGIVLSVVFESIRFFKVISFWDFITGTKWQPDTAFLIGAGRDTTGVAPPLFGSVPVFAGTFMITAIAMLVAVPVGLFSAIYMSEYASFRVRGRLKPMLEILAGIPTVVYGFFAAITISPIVVKVAHAFGLEASYTNALAPGLIMGVMIIPFVSSLSDDVIRAVPQSLRDGSLALGMTKAETIRHIVLPAAMPGIVSAFLLAMSRAIGETMIVVMAAGLRPNLTMNPLEGMTTVTVKIVEALTGDQEFDSAFTLAAFALGLVLLMVTLTLNIVSTIVVRKFKQRYE